MFYCFLLLLQVVNIIFSCFMVGSLYFMIFLGAGSQDGDALQMLLPIIAHSPLSTFSLVGVAGVCAPLLEETIFRGFLMTSLTKWWGYFFYIIILVKKPSKLNPKKTPKKPQKKRRFTLSNDTFLLLLTPLLLIPIFFRVSFGRKWFLYSDIISVVGIDLGISKTRLYRV